MACHVLQRHWYALRPQTEICTHLELFVGHSDYHKIQFPTHAMQAGWACVLVVVM